MWSSSTKRIRPARSAPISVGGGSARSSRSPPTKPPIANGSAGRPGGRAPTFDRDAYKQRNTVERCINRLKQWRGLATRYDKTAAIYLAGLHVAAIFIWSDDPKETA